MLAHPHLLRSNKVLKKVLEHALDGLEAYYGRFFRNQDEKWVKIAEYHGLFTTGGSDFHGDVKPDVMLGASYTPIDVFELLQA